MVKEPENINLWNRSMRGAYRKGVRAAQDGQPVDACPYEDKRKASGRLTWSRAYQAAWIDGWNDAKRQEGMTGG